MCLCVGEDGRGEMFVSTYKEMICQETVFRTQAAESFAFPQRCHSASGRPATHSSSNGSGWIAVNAATMLA